MADKKDDYNRVQDVRIKNMCKNVDKLEDEIKSIAKSMIVINHNTTENARDIVWIKRIEIVILTSVLGLAFAVLRSILLAS